MTTSAEAMLVQRLTRYAAAAATCADRYAKVFYPQIRDADEKLVCCIHGGEDMDHHIRAAEVLRGLGVDLAGMVERPIGERGLDGADILDGARSWTERAVLSAVFERALVILLEGLATSDHPPTAKLAGVAIAREDKHAAHGVGLLRKVCTTADGRREAQAAVHRLWPVALAVLDTDQARSELAVRVGAELDPLGLSAGGGIH